MKLRDLLELCRVSNLPTVWSNVAMGAAWGSAITDDLARRRSLIPFQDSADLRSILWSFLPMMIAGSLIYCGGMVLNDAMDAKIDLAERPHRPIPSGRVSRSHAYLIAFAMLIGAFILLFRYPSPWVVPTAAVLIALVITYNTVHQQTIFGVVLMGLCRAALIVMAITSVSMGEYGLTPLMTIAPAVIFLYTLLISVVARNEVAKSRAWIVGAMIAAMPIVDAALLLAVGEWFVAPFCVLCAAATYTAQRWVAGS